jgi:phosphoglycerate dehydrogenase-like enzyme
MAELVVALMLSFSTGLHRLIGAQRDLGGPPALIQEVRRSTFELAGQSLGVVGLGTIGMSLAEDACGLGMRVLGVRRRLSPDTAPGQPLPPHLAAVYGPEGLATVLAEADHVALCLPLTPATAGIMGEAQLRQMRRTAYLYNVGRGDTIDQPALERALAEGWIAGAALDVTTPEPLPATSPLWTMPNVILSQHSSGHSEEAWRKVTEVFLTNVRAYEQGAPLPTIVDLDAGY